MLLIFAGLWFMIFVAAAATAGNGLLSFAWLLLALAGPVALDRAVERGAARTDWIGKYCRRQKRIYWRR